MKPLLKIAALIMLVLILILIPLFGIYVASAQALPNEGRYQLKLQSEKIIDSLSSLNPNLYAYFSLLKSQRRYQEVIGMVDKNQDITGSNKQFLDQVKQTLFDIQSVGDTSVRLNYLAQYQSFIANSKENFSYKVSTLNDQLGVDQSKGVKTFTIDEYGSEQGKLVSQKKVYEQKGLTAKEPVSKDLLSKNIAQLEQAENALGLLIQK